jgi:hypothetical protein
MKVTHDGRQRRRDNRAVESGKQHPEHQRAKDEVQLSFRDVGDLGFVH